MVGVGQARRNFEGRERKNSRSLRRRTPTERRPYRLAPPPKGHASPRQVVGTPLRRRPLREFDFESKEPGDQPMRPLGAWVSAAVGAERRPYRLEPMCGGLAKFRQG